MLHMLFKLVKHVFEHQYGQNQFSDAVVVNTNTKHFFFFSNPQVRICLVNGTASFIHYG